MCKRVSRRVHAHAGACARVRVRVQVRVRVLMHVRTYECVCVSVHVKTNVLRRCSVRMVGERVIISTVYLPCAKERG